MTFRPDEIINAHKETRGAQMGLREALAEYAHEAWAGWMRYLFSNGTFNEDGTWTMPKWRVERWTRQMNTPYQYLPENEKPSDREEADKMIAIGRRYVDRIVAELMRP
jgi:hypothetical protein